MPKKRNSNRYRTKLQKANQDPDSDMVKDFKNKKTELYLPFLESGF